ncbi:ABC transporter permease [Conexibacter sp. SYSU D00693]|uniref:ABC transporter permease subunit n=1 Tax=Conexibacter sp. SYSU D00693 TaxID=2812560 RepID=UPI00196B9739|nr:ABC transporter permease [Conexibacter sp. SYSU D00693]
MQALVVFLLRRLVGLVAVLAGATALTHALLRVLRPDLFGDDLGVVRGTLEKLERVFLHLDLGRGGVSNRPVLDLMLEGLPADAALVAGGLLLGLLGGLAAGAVAARGPRWRSVALQALALVALCAPVYWVALVANRAFFPGFGWIPFGLVAGEGAAYQPLTEDPLQWLRSLLLPWTVLALPLAAASLRLTRSGLREVAGADFLQTARAKGLDERTVVRHHALPVATAPVLTLAGANMALLVMNVILVEQVFAVPGVFRETLRAVRVGDFESLQGLVLVGALLVVLANTAVDLVARRLDPQVR